jgi:enoyl-CoA hydratase/carnithine racemase
MIKYSYLNHVTTLVISRPERRNALNWETIGELANGISNAEVDPSCHCLVITGDGDHFVAGRDLGEANSDANLNETLANDEAYTRIFTALRSMSKPSVSVVRGYAVAGGFTLAMGCDFVLADRTAKFGALEMRGGFPAAVNTAILGQLAGPRQSLELLLSADMFDAEHLFRIGLINKIFDNSDELEIGAKLFAGKLAALDPTAVKMTKETQRATTGMPITDALVMAKHLNALLMSSGRINEAAELFKMNKKSKS